MILFKLAYFSANQSFYNMNFGQPDSFSRKMKSITFYCKRFLCFKTNWSRKGEKAMWINKNGLSAALTRDAVGNTGRDPPANQM